MREAATVVDELAGVLDRNRGAVERLRAELHEATERKPRLELQLRSLNRFAEAGSPQDPENRLRIEREISETRTTCDELSAELARLQATAEQPRRDRQAVATFIDRMSKHIGDQGARLRAQVGGLAA
jgi:chromosome segregation ATPase